MNLEVVTRDPIPVRLREATLAPPVFGIRHVDLLNAGEINPDAPGLHVFFDCDLITPDGTVLTKLNDFASAFNVAGTDDTPGDGVTAWLGSHVLESVPADVDEFTLTAAFVDDDGRIGMDQIRLKVDRSKPSGQALTPAPETSSSPIGHEGDPEAPEVTMIAPRVPTSIALGQQDNTLNANNGALFFIQVSAVVHGNAEIAVSENGELARALRTPCRSGSSSILRGSLTPPPALSPDPIAIIRGSRSRFPSRSVRQTATSLLRG